MREVYKLDFYNRKKCVKFFGIFNGTGTVAYPELTLYSLNCIIETSVIKIQFFEEEFKMGRPKIASPKPSHIGILLDHERYAQHVSYAELARRAGKNNISNAHATLRRAGDLSVSNAIEYAEALGCKLLLQYSDGSTIAIQKNYYAPNVDNTYKDDEEASKKR